MNVESWLSTNIDIIIATWISANKIEGLSWESRCNLRKKMYDMVICHSECVATDETKRLEKAIRLYEENEYSRTGKEVDKTIANIKEGKMPYYDDECFGKDGNMK